jgi:hypothetical protein
VAPDTVTPDGSVRLQTVAPVSGSRVVDVVPSPTWTSPVFDWTMLVRGPPDEADHRAWSEATLSTPSRVSVGLSLLLPSS